MSALVADEADIDLSTLVASNARDFAVFENAKQFRLHGRRHVADLIEKNRAMIGVFEDAFTIRDRIGERALDVAEKLPFEKALIECSAVQRDVS